MFGVVKTGLKIAGIGVVSVLSAIGASFLYCAYKNPEGLAEVVNAAAQKE